jgi:SAM-dependent methyltransferase
MSVPDRSTFECAYAGQAPWDIGEPQKPFIEGADLITGSVLDAGCGTGDTALFLAGRGCKVTGIDFVEVPIQQAQRKAAEWGVQVKFLVKDALTLKGGNRHPFQCRLPCDDLRARVHGPNYVGRTGRCCRSMVVNDAKCVR